MSEPPLLEVEELVKHFGGVPAVDGATLSVREGSVTALIGPNGAGKTSLFNLISGFQRPDSGQIYFAGHRIDNLSTHRIARAGLVRTFQNPKILRRMSVLDNMLLAGQRQPGESLWRIVTPRATRRREYELRERAYSLLSAVKLDNHVTAYAGTLSGGQRKLLEFARALMTQPRLVMLDEPLAGVNPALREEMLDLILTIRQRERLTILLIEHDLEAVMAASEMVAVMNAGRVIFFGPPGDVQRNDDVIDAYLGSFRVAEPAT